MMCSGSFLFLLLSLPLATYRCPDITRPRMVQDADSISPSHPTPSFPLCQAIRGTYDARFFTPTRGHDRARELPRDLGEGREEGVNSTTAGDEEATHAVWSAVWQVRSEED